MNKAYVVLLDDQFIGAFENEEEAIELADIVPSSVIVISSFEVNEDGSRTLLGIEGIVH